MNSGRLIVPGSELSTHRYLTQDSALDEVMGTEFSKLDLNQLYYASDRILANKEFIVWGLPFYTNDDERTFDQIFREELKIDEIG